MGRESLPPPPPPPVDMSQPPNPPYISSVMVNPAAPPVNNPPPPPPPPPPMMVQSRDSRESSAESELPLPPPPPIPLDMTAPPPPLDNRAPPPPPPPPPMPMPSSPPDSGRVVANGDINKLPGSSSTPKGSPGKLGLFITGHPKRNSLRLGFGADVGRGVDEQMGQSSSSPLQQAKAPTRVPNIPAPALDGRSDLLKAIRDGKNAAAVVDHRLFSVLFSRLIII